MREFSDLVARARRPCSDWPGTVQLPAWSESDFSKPCSRPFTASGRLGIYQPLITSCRKPLRRGRSRCVRDRSRARIAPAPSAVWSFRRISRDWASFSGVWP